MYDVENEILLDKSIHVETFQIEKNAEILSFTGVAPQEIAKLKIPKKIKIIIYLV